MRFTRRRFLLGASSAPSFAPVFTLMSSPLLADEPHHNIAIRDLEFDPARLTVRVGDRLRFTNHDLAPHTATAEDGSWDTGTLPQNASTTLTVTNDWTNDWGGTYFCAFHPHMQASLTILR